MTTHKTFKRRVRVRMTRTGESYTAARRQLLHKAPAVDGDPGATETTSAGAKTAPTSDEAVVRATGRHYGEWFGLLDAWGAADRGHTPTAAWLKTEHGVPGWWAQSITVGYERARGLRAIHQMPGGFQVGANRTIGVDADRVLEAFTDDRLRARWLAGVRLTRRPTTAARVARFDWPEPPSRLMVAVDPKGPVKTTVSVMHEKLPDAATAEALKTYWRQQLAALKAALEG